MCLFWLALISTFGFIKTSAAQGKWVLNKSCILRVNGSTNINKFSCVIPEYIGADTLYLAKPGKSDEAIKITGAMLLDVEAFDCHNPMMTSDLRKSLKAKTYPKMSIRFVSINKYPDPDKKDPIKGTVIINLAGVSKTFEVNYSYVLDGNTLTMIGLKQVNFSDFDIVPPRKLGGMIKTNNELSVSFILNVKILK